MLTWNNDTPKFSEIETCDPHVDDELAAEYLSLINAQEHMTLFEENRLEYFVRNTHPEDRKLFAKFVDEYVTCHRPKDNIVRHDYFVENSEKEDHDLYDKSFPLDVQEHRHRENCRIIDKDGYRDCKNQFPRPILPETLVLESINPVEHEQYVKHNKNYVKEYQTLWKTIRSKLQTIHKEGEASSVKTAEELCAHLNITFIEYVLAIRTSLIKPGDTAVFLKRTYRELMLNNYNPAIFVRHRSNMDIQIVTNPYNVAAYLCKYVMKDKKEQSLIIRKSIEEAKSGK